MKIIIYLINLDGSDERLKSAKAQLEREGVDFIRVPAFDGRGRDPEEFKDYDPQKAQAYMGRALSGGEIGCYYSHIDCANRFLASDANYAVVLEDDIFIHPGAIKKLENIIMELEVRNKCWDVINFGAQKNKIYSKIFIEQDVTVVQAHYFPMTTTGVAWSKKGAGKFVRECQQIYAPIDNMLREWQSCHGLGISTVPALVSTTGAESEIDQGEKPLRSNVARSLSYRVKKQWRLTRNKVAALKFKISY